MRPLIPMLASAALLGVLTSAAAASPLITLAEFQALFPDYVNHEVQNGFPAPCVDVAGMLTLSVNVGDILGTVTEPIAVAMVCQQVGLPPFTPVGPVTFSDPNVQLLGLSSVPDHPDAFSIEYLVPLGSDSFLIFIENTGWPEGCLDDLLDLAAWDLVSVPTETTTFSQIKALF